MYVTFFATYIGKNLVVTKNFNMKIFNIQKSAQKIEITNFFFV